jgi:hypothetical protein
MLRAVFLRNTERRAPGWRRPRVVARPQRTQAAASPFPACPAPRCSSTDSFPHERGSASQPRSGDRSWGQLRGVSGPREALQGRGGNKAQQPMNTAIPDRKHASPLIPAPIPSLHGKEGVDGSSPSEGFYSPRSTCKSTSSVVRPITVEHLPLEAGNRPRSPDCRKTPANRTCCPPRRSTSLQRRDSTLCPCGSTESRWKDDHFIAAARAHESWGCFYKRQVCGIASRSRKSERAR